MRPCHLLCIPLLLVRESVTPLLAGKFPTVRCLCFFSERFIPFKQGVFHTLSQHSCICASGEGGWPGLPPIALKVCLACLATVPCFALSLGRPHSCILASNLTARRFSFCVSTPSQFPLPLQASGLLYADEPPSLFSPLLVGARGRTCLRSQSSRGVPESPK